MRRFIRKLRTMFRNFDQPVIFKGKRDGKFSVRVRGEDWSDVAVIYYGDSDVRDLGSITLFLNAHDNWATVIDCLYDRSTGSALNLAELIKDSKEMKRVRENARSAIDT